MLRLPAVAGRFYPSNPEELTALIRKYTVADTGHSPIPLRACLVPHAGYVYSGHVAGGIIRGASRRQYFRAAPGARRWETRELTRSWRKR